MRTLTSFVVLLASLLSSASCARPEQRDALYASAMSVERELGTIEREGAYCGIRSLQSLGNHALEKHVMDRALAICLEQKPKNECRPLADLWLERNLTAEFSASMTFCDMLRPLITEAGLEEDELAGSRRRGHRRRNYQRRRRERRRTDRRRERRRRQVVCGKTQVRLTKHNTCCNINVEGSWSFTKSIAGESTVEIYYGYTKEVTDFEMQGTYEATTTSASAGFEAYGGSASVSVGHETGEEVVHSTEIKSAVEVNKKTTDTWFRKDGAYLWQWTWTTIFHGSKACVDEPDAIVVTPFWVQSGEKPQCLPTISKDLAHQRCEEGGQMP